MLNLPAPKLIVEGYTSPRGGHLYRVLTPAGALIEEALPSVTKKLDIIGGSKTGALMGWAVKTALRHVEEQIHSEMASGTGTIDDQFLARVIAAGRKRPEKEKDAAADLGTRVHNLVDKWIMGERGFPMLPDERVAFENFLRFVEEKKLRFVCGDLPVASARYKYGGRLDALAMIGKSLVLLDWKTSNGIRDDYALQVAGYRMALEETYGVVAKRAMVVRFDKVDPSVLDYKEVAIAQATRTWKALVEFEREYFRRLWK